MRTLAMQGLTQSAFRKSTTEVYDNFTKTSKQTNTCYDNLAEGNFNLTPPLPKSNIIFGKYQKLISADYLLNEAVHSAQIRTASRTATTET